MAHPRTSPRRSGVLSRSLVVGAAASLVDLATLSTLVSVLGLAPEHANVPSLALGAAVQFLGCRHLVFDASRGPLLSQVGGFVAAEAGALVLNAAAFHGLVSACHVPYVVARLAAALGVYLGFSLPVWGRVFSHADATRKARHDRAASPP